ncbi:MAG: hypothetical protein V1932_04455 [Chloroflexota bacterium]
MPKQSRKGRMKHKTRRSPAVSAIKEASQTQPLPISSRPAVKVKSSTLIGERVDRQRQAITELKRIGLIAVIMLTLLIVVSLLIR